MESHSLRRGYWILVPAVIIAAGILGYYTFRSSQEHAQLGEETIAQSLLSVAQQRVQEVERYIRAADSTVYRLVNPNDSSTIDTVWLPAAETQTPSVRSVLLIDREGSVIQWASTEDRKTRREFLRVFRQELVKSLDLASADPRLLLHVHQLAGDESYLLSYKAHSTLAGQVTYIVAHHDTDYLVEEVFPPMLATEESTPRYNVVDQTNRVVFGPDLSDVSTYTVGHRFPTTLYEWRLQVAPQQAALLQAQGLSRMRGTAALPIMSFAIILLSAIFFLYAAEKERRLSNLKSELMANVSHELKTPLSVVRMFSDMLRSGRVPSEERRLEYLDIICRESERLTSLIDNVLDFSALDSGQGTYRLTQGRLGGSHRPRSRRVSLPQRAGRRRNPAGGAGDAARGADRPGGDRPRSHQPPGQCGEVWRPNAGGARTEHPALRHRHRRPRSRSRHTSRLAPARLRSILPGPAHWADARVRNRSIAGEAHRRRPTGAVPGRKTRPAAAPSSASGFPSLQATDRASLPLRHSASIFAAMEDNGRSILLVEDDPALALGLSDSLRFEGYRVVHTAKGEQAVELARSEAVDCIILDLMLPDMNGYQVCETIRERDPILPILMLTARGQESDKIRGLEAGADDYMTKPFAIGELVARLRALFRRADRSVRPSSAEIQIGDINIETGAQTLTHGSETSHLSFYEVELLKFLWEREGEPVSRDEILEKIWGLEAGPNNRTVDNFIVKLRRKIEPKPDRPVHILTVYGVGYKLVC